ncbi:MAG TPA: TrbG/VirB9 family P-type conjugative transfer protein [Gemmatimonadaceae bacterium]|nr:TrbG/VirB9 family P-type conjugative transfer protein [Gemmatimonadaceae bacterium]
MTTFNWLGQWAPFPRAAVRSTAFLFLPLTAMAQSATPQGRAVAVASSTTSRTANDSTRARPDDAIDAATREFKSTGVARVVTEGNFMTFPFGHSQPTVTCARLRACIIELQPGEIVLSRIAGDLERWEIAPAPSGPDGRTTLVVVKPKDCDLTTNLVLATDRRIYDLSLDSPPCRNAQGRSTTNPQDPYARHVRFYYPDETIAQWAKPAPPRIESDFTQLNFGYDVRREKQFPWQPAQVFDDGAHVYIKLPDAAKHAEAPVLFTVANDGSRTLLNYSVVGDTYVTDRLFDRGVLVAGIDGKERTVSIEKRGRK